MTKLLRISVWATVGFILAFLGALLLATGLDRADKLSSVLGALAGLAGVILSAYGIVLTRQGISASGGYRQTVDSTQVGGSVIQATQVRGGIRLGGVHASPPRAASSLEVDGRAGDAIANQEVRRSQVTGHIAQVRDLTGDVDIER